MSSANHLSPIRSFLIDSHRPIASRGEFYAKYFCAVRELKLLAKSERHGLRARSICSAGAIGFAKTALTKNPYFIALFATSAILAPMLSCNGAQSVAARNSDRLLTISGAVLASLTHTIK